MKHDNNQYFYSSLNNYPFYLMYNKPDDAIPMTVSMEEYYEDGLKNNLIIIKNIQFDISEFKDGISETYPFKMIDPDSILTPEEKQARELVRLKSTAESLINSSARFDTLSFQSKYWSGDQIEEFTAWRHQLFDIIYGNCDQLPIIPEFVQQAIDGNVEKQ